MTNPSMAAIPIATGRYQDWKPSLGVPIRSTVGEPRWWRGPLGFTPSLAPYGVFGRDDLTVVEQQRRYVARLDRSAVRIVAWFAAVAAEYPGVPLVVLCFCDVDAGQACHRIWFATGPRRGGRVS